MIVINLIFLLGLFFLISKAADLVIVHARSLAKHLGMNIFLLGLILGFLTSTPELFIGLNSIFQGINQLAFGNLIGGIFVLLALIWGLSIVLNREVKLEYNFSFEQLFLAGLFLVFPLILSLDGSLNFYDGIIIIFFYLILIYFIFRRFKKTHIQLAITREGRVTKSIFYIIVGLLGIIFCSKLIINLTLFFIGEFDIPIFLVGLLAFSLGTNFPEIILTLRAWYKKVKYLSLGNLLGSAMANTLIIGIISIIRNINLDTTISYYILFILFIALILIFISFAISQRKFTRREGIILIAIYCLFIVTQIFFLNLD